MNVHINLITDEEKRHGGAIPWMFVLRCVGITIPLLVLLFIAYQLITLNMSRTQLERTEERIADKKPQLALIGEIRKQEKTYRDVVAQLDGLKNMRVDWNRQLAALRKSVPLDVQLISLSVSRRVVTATDNTPAASYSLLLSGKTGGATPEAHLTQFRQNMLKEPGLTNAIDTISVPEGAFVQDNSPGAASMDRLFEVNCQYKIRGVR